MELTCEQVSHRYGRHAVLHDVTVTIRTGMTGILGPNGAGKSTLLQVLATAMRPSSGRVLLDGRDLHGDDRDEMRRQIGFLPQRFDLMRWSSVHRNVAYAAWCAGVDRDECFDAASAALATVDLSDVADRRAGSLSGGQQQRVGIACAIAHRPALVLLDEPTAGLDPAQRVQVRAYLGAIAETAIVILSTHIVEDLALMASDVVVIERGAVAHTGSIESLGALGQARPVRGLSDLEAGYVQLISTPPGAMPCASGGAR